MTLKGKVAIITGGGSGIGRGIALRLARAGAWVVIADLDLPAAQQTATLVQAAGGEALALDTDTSQVEKVTSMIEQTLEHWGQVDVLVNNAGVSSEVPFLEMEESEWDRVLSINLKGVFLCSQAVARVMVQAGRGGKIVNIASVNAEVAGMGLAHYCASKGGVRMLTKAVALELAPYEINVNAVGPGIVDTPMTAATIQDSERRQAITGPWGRVGKPRDIAEAVLFLASEGADFITGTTLFVDGGWLIQ